jgi:hypothetical protein
MRVLHHPGELSALPNELRRLLERRFRQLQSDDWGEFILVEPGDGLSELDRRFGGWLLSESGEFDPPYEWLAHHPGARCYELVLILSDDGRADVLIVPDEITVDPTIRAFCRAHAVPPD